MSAHTLPKKRRINPDEHYDGSSHSSKRFIDNKDKVHAALVADHYNKRGNTSCAERRNSKIYYMRNFNNWIKSVLIKKYLDKLYEDGMKHRPTVLDLGVGKGGDLLKWDKGQIQKLICTDIAETSISQCQERYNTLKKRSRNKRVFNAEFIVCDSAKESLYKKFSDPNMDIDMTSCQFVIHYTFETEDRAETMVRNACMSLKEGGYFIGTTINDEKLLTKAKESGGTFGNDVYSVEFQSNEPYPDYGCKYVFKLHGVVDCPEFLLRKHSLISICKKYGMKLVEWKPFSEFFEENSKPKENYRLIQRMQALEVFPQHSQQLNSSIEGDYSHAEAECDRIRQRYPGEKPKVATLSKTEWEAASLYVVYVFVKDETNAANYQEEERRSTPKEEKIPLVIL